MKTFIFLLSSAALLTTACTQNKPKETASTSEIGSECFLAVSKTDSAYLSFKNVKGKVEGTLSFNFAEKDDSEGRITGEFKGDTLFVNYSFKAEGVHSVNPLVFLKSGEDLKQGYGEILTYMGKTYFKDHAQLQFNEGFLFKPTECK